MKLRQQCNTFTKITFLQLLLLIRLNRAVQLELILNGNMPTRKIQCSGTWVIVIALNVAKLSKEIWWRKGVFYEECSMGIFL